MTFLELMNAFSIKEDMICNKKVYEALARQMKMKRPVTPVIGAGLSVWADYPMWGALLIDMAKETPAEEDVIAALKCGRYEYAASKLEETYMRNNFLEVLAKVFSPEKLREEKRPKYQYKLIKLFKGHIVTTNYDISLERLFKSTFTVLPEDEFQSHEIKRRIQQHIPMLVKLHGTIEDREH